MLRTESSSNKNIKNTLGFLSFIEKVITDREHNLRNSCYVRV